MPFAKPHREDDKQLRDFLLGIKERVDTIRRGVASDSVSLVELFAGLREEDQWPVDEIKRFSEAAPPGLESFKTRNSGESRRQV